MHLFSQINTRHFISCLSSAVLFFLFVCPNSLPGQSSRITSIEKYTAHHWNLEQGLSQAETYDFIKDKNGFIWITTKHGLNRFNGNEFKIYYHDQEKKYSNTEARNEVPGIYLRKQMHFYFEQHCVGSVLIEIVSPTSFQ